MIIAVTTQGQSEKSDVDSRFGRSGNFALFDDDKKTWSFVSNSQNLQAAQGAGLQSAAAVINAGATTLITGHCGPKAFGVLHSSKVAVYSAKNITVEEAVEKLHNNELTLLENADVEAHW